MAGIWTYDFSETAVGVQPSYITRMWGSDSDAIVGEDLDAENDRAIFTSGGTGGNAFKFNEPSDDADSANVEFLVRAKIQNNDAWYFCVCRASGTIASQYGYGVQNRSTGLQIRQWTNTSNASGSTIFSSTDYTRVIVQYDWYRFRVNGTRLDLKYWTGAIGDEPAGWLFGGTNSAHSSGWVGFYSRANNANHLIDKIAIATGGLTASFDAPAARRRSPLLLTPW